MIIGIPALMMGGKRRPVFQGIYSNEVTTLNQTAKTISVQVPAGTVAGDLLVLVLCASTESGSVSTPPQWDEVYRVTGSSSNCALTIATRVAQAGDSVWNVNVGTVYSIFGVIMSFRGSAGLGANAISGNTTGPSINLDIASSLLLIFCGASGSTTPPGATVPPGMTERLLLQSDGATREQTLQISTQMDVANGPTGTRVSGTSGTGSRRSMMLEVKGT